MKLGHIAVFLAGIVLIGKFIDFLLGSMGRLKAKDMLVVNPWIQLEQLSFIDILSKATTAYEACLKRVFGEFDTGRSYFVYFFLLVSIIPLVDYARDIFPSAGVVKPVYEYISPDFSGIIFIGYVPTYTSLAFTRWVVRKLKARPRLVNALAYGFASTAITASMLIYVHLVGLLALYFVEGLRVELPVVGSATIMPIAIPLSAIVVLPTVFLFLFLLAVILIVLADRVRLFLKFVLERIDENNSSPISLLVAFVGLLFTFLSAIIDYI